MSCRGRLSRQGFPVDGDETWRQVKEKNTDLRSMLTDLPTRFNGVVNGHTDYWVQRIPLDLKNIEADLQAQLAQAVRSQLVTRSGVDPEDADFPRAVALERSLASLTSRVVQLHELCEGYRAETAALRARVRELAVSAARSKRELLETLSNSRLVGSLLEPLSARGRDVPPSQWLSDLLPPPSAFTASGPAGRRRGTGSSCGPCSLPASARASSSSSRLRGPRRTPRSSASQPPAAGAQAQQPAPPAVLPPKVAVTAAEPEADALARCPLPKLGKGVADTLPASTTSQEEIYLNRINKLQAKLQETRKARRQFSAAMATDACRRGRLEEFFLLCIHDFREAASTQRGLKHAAAVAGRGDRTLRGNQPGRQLTALDRIVKVMAESDDLHMLLFEKMFPHRQAYFKNRGRPPPVPPCGSDAVLPDASLDPEISFTFGGTLWEPTCEHTADSMDVPSLLRRGAK